MVGCSKDLGFSDLPRQLPPHQAIHTYPLSSVFICGKILAFSSGTHANVLPAKSILPPINTDQK
jgi:hypothetical protein